MHTSLVISFGEIPVSGSKGILNFKTLDLAGIFKFHFIKKGSEGVVVYRHGPLKSTFLISIIYHSPLPNDYRKPFVTVKVLPPE